MLCNKVELLEKNRKEKVHKLTEDDGTFHSKKSQHFHYHLLMRFPTTAPYRQTHQHSRREFVCCVEEVLSVLFAIEVSSLERKAESEYCDFVIY